MNDLDEKVKRSKKYSKAPHERMMAFALKLRDLDERGVEGDVVECGVWRGGHIILARMVSPQRRCWLYDTFEGMTEPGPHDGEKANRLFGKHGRDLHKGGKKAAASLAEVLTNLEEETVLEDDKLRFVIGDVRATLRLGFNLPDRIAMLRLDTDFYDSTKVELETLWPLLVAGGVMIVDDYGHWMGARKAVDEYLCAADRARLKPIDYTAVVMVKP